MSTLGEDYGPRVVSAEMLAVRSLETKLPEETDAYRHVMQVAHQSSGEAFSNKVSVQRRGGVPETRPADGPVRREAEGFVIHRGDLLHTDFGFTYLGFATDTQHHAYVLRSGKAEAPAGLREGLRRANRLQDRISATYTDLPAAPERAYLPRSALSHRPTVFSLWRNPPR